MILMYTAIEVVSAGDGGGVLGHDHLPVISGLCPLIYFRVWRRVRFEWALKVVRDAWCFLMSEEVNKQLNGLCNMT